MIVLKRDENAKPSVISLDFMTAAAAKQLGAAFAQIEPWSRYPFSEESLTRFLSERESDAPRYVIYADAAVAGAICVRGKWLRGPYLQFLGVVPKFQKRGYGQLAFAWFEAHARQTAMDNFWVAASSFNASAIGFYERLGFKQVAVLDDLIKPGFSELLFRKRLT